MKWCVFIEQRSTNEMQATGYALHVMAPLAIGMDRLQNRLHGPDRHAHRRQRTRQRAWPWLLE